MAARTLGPGWLGGPARLALGALRSVPGLIWGVLFVASVGFGPSAGVFALACHSAGVLGKSYSEILEHADPAPADALRSYGLSALGVLRFCVWPQVLPRFLDATVARWEHNVRSATTVGVVGGGGLGLQIVTAFHLFEYREAIALVAVLLAFGERHRFIGRAAPRMFARARVSAGADSPRRGRCSAAPGRSPAAPRGGGAHRSRGLHAQRVPEFVRTRLRDLGSRSPRALRQALQSDFGPSPHYQPESARALGPAIVL